MLKKRCLAKLTNGEVSKALNYFQERLKIPFVYQVVCHGEKAFFSKDVHVVPADRFLASLV